MQKSGHRPEHVTSFSGSYSYLIITWSPFQPSVVFMPSPGTARPALITAARSSCKYSSLWHDFIFTTSKTSLVTTTRIWSSQRPFCATTSGDRYQFASDASAFFTLRSVSAWAHRLVIRDFRLERICLGETRDRDEDKAIIHTSALQRELNL